MQYYNQLHIEGFRRLSDLKLELRPLCVLIGANGSGKTSLLDVFSMLARSAEGRLKETLSDRGGVVSNLTGGDARWMSFKLSTTTAKGVPLHYRLALKPQGAGYEIVDEALYLQGAEPPFFKYIESQHGTIRYLMPLTDQPDSGQLMPPVRPPEPGETALARDPGLYVDPTDFRSRLASVTHYHALDVGPRAAVRLPQPLRPAILPGANGEDLVSCLFYIRETDRDRFDLIEDTLRAGFHDFERLDFPPVAAGTLAMTWRDKNFSRPLFMHQLSEGMLRFLWLATLLQSPGLTALTLIDEPEVSLHPELLSLLAELMREASLRSQLIVATHADRLVRFLQPSEVVAMDISEDGRARATWADEFDLQAWLADYTLDEIWRLGRIGGRP